MTAPMSTTTPAALVVAVAAIADVLKCTLLGPRDALNQAPRDAYTAQLRRSVACGKALPVHMVLAISMADAEDRRIPIGEVTRFYEEAAEQLRARRREVEKLGLEATSLQPLSLRETAAQTRFDIAQLRVSANPDDAGALEELIAASAAYDDPQNRLVAAARERLAGIRSRRVREGVAP